MTDSRVIIGFRKFKDEKSDFNLKLRNWQRKRVLLSLKEFWKFIHYSEEAFLHFVLDIIYF